MRNELSRYWFCEWLKNVAKLLGLLSLGGCYMSHEIPDEPVRVWGPDNGSWEAASVAVERWNSELGYQRFTMTENREESEIVVGINHLGGPALGKIERLENACHVIVYHHRNAEVVGCVVHEIVGLCVGLTPERAFESCDEM